MGRRRKQTITYDSKETSTVLGLIALILAAVFFITAFIAPTENNFFTQAKYVFGQTTIVVGAFLLNLGARMLGASWPLSRTGSLIAQLILCLLIPAFVSSLSGVKTSAILAREAGQAGGWVGYTLAWDLFADSLVFAQYTPLVLGALIAIFTPLALSLSLTDTVAQINRLAQLFVKIGKWFFEYRGDKSSEAEQPTAKESGGKLRFSDFQRPINEPVKPAIPQPTTILPRTINTKPLDQSGEGKVDFKEAEVGETGLSFTELKYPGWQLPPSSLLNQYKKAKPSDADKERNAKIIEETLNSFDIDAKVMDAYIGPSVVQYAIDIPLGVKVSKVVTLSPNLALALGVDSQAVRIETIPGTTYLGIEVPRAKRDEVKIRELAESEEFIAGKAFLPLVVGKDINGRPVIADAQKMPHLLIAGATGSGKSILTNSFIVSMLMRRTPDELRLVLVDPKRVELSDYNGIPHLLTPVITDMDKVVNALKWLVNEMERRYTVLSAALVRNIEGYNQKLGFSAMPYIVVVIDEMADMMMTANRVEAETAIVRLAQKARAVGIHLVLATQRPSVNVITGLIKANIPARIGMSVTSGIDSRVILDDIGAESLMGKGDMLYKAPDKTKPTRLQGGFVSQEEVTKVVDFIKQQAPEVEYMTSILESESTSGLNPGEADSMSDDDLFMQAVRVVVNYQKGSSSFLQRKLNIGFNRAARLLEEMEEMGIVGPAQGSKTREVLITDVEDFVSKKNPSQTQPQDNGAEPSPF